GARLQTRSLRAASSRGLWQLAVAQQLAQRSARRLRGIRQGAAAPSARGRVDEPSQGRRQVAAAGDDAAGWRRRSALWTGRLARPPRRRGSRSGLSSASLYLAPNHPLALLSLADLYESLKKPALAIKIYERIPPNSPLHRNAAIQMAANLDSLD